MTTMKDPGKRIIITAFDRYNPEYIRQAALLLAESFPHCYSETASEEIQHCLEEDRIMIMAEEDGMLLGFAGAIPQYGHTGWELHPVVVHKARRSEGIGSLLLESLEKEAASRGGITIYLGTDDEHFRTSLSDSDLYKDTFTKIENIVNYDRHPYEFYIKQGYRIVGVIPDASGLNKPDIIMAKRIV